MLEMFAMDMPTGAKALYCYMHCMRSNKVPYDREKMCCDLNISFGTFQEYVSILLENGLIIRRRSDYGDRRRFVYEVK